MKQKVPLLIATLLVLSQPVWAYDFSYTYQDKTLFYSITNSNAHMVQVVNPLSGSYYSYVSGDVVIPDSVEYNNTKYAVTRAEGACSLCQAAEWGHEMEPILKQYK